MMGFSEVRNQHHFSRILKLGGVQGEGGVPGEP